MRRSWVAAVPVALCVALSLTGAKCEKAVPIDTGNGVVLSPQEQQYKEDYDHWRREVERISASNTWRQQHGWPLAPLPPPPPPPG